MTLTLKDALTKLEGALADVLKSAKMDDKTPLLNALALSESKALFASSETSSSIVVFADINRFKKINTEHGYDAGDAAINKVGVMMQKLFVEGCEAEAFRQSGDEFIILLRNKYLEDFKNFASSFSKCAIKFSDTTFSVPVSFGYAISDGKSDFETMRARAEIACQKAKKQGDGICIEWTEELERTSFESLRDNCPKCNSIISCEVPKEMKLNKVQFCAACGENLGAR